MESRYGITIYRPRVFSFRESLIYGEAVRRGDFRVSRSMENMAIMRLLGIPASVLSGESGYSRGKMDVTNFE